MEIAIMIEGQDGVTWPIWKRIVSLVEGAGYAGLFRSDHFTNADPPDKESLELWVSLAWLADHTSRIEFGPLVTPFSFRNPVFTARMGKDVDDLSGGRLVLGIGAGWQEREHTMFGLPLLEPGDRLDRFAEGAEICRRLLHEETPVSFDGEYYQLREARLLPRPQRPGGPRLLIGGNGEKRTLPLAARFADEWNGVFLTPQRFRELNDRLTSILVEQGRAPESVRRSLMCGLVWGRTDAELRDKLRGRDASALTTRGAVVGVGGSIRTQLDALASAGVQRVMLQWLDLDDLEGLEALAQVIL